MFNHCLPVNGTTYLISSHDQDDSVGAQGCFRINRDGSTTTCSCSGAKFYTLDSLTLRECLTWVNAIFNVMTGISRRGTKWKRKAGTDADFAGRACTPSVKPTSTGLMLTKPRKGNQRIRTHEHICFWHACRTLLCTANCDTKDALTTRA